MAEEKYFCDGFRAPTALKMYIFLTGLFITACLTIIVTSSTIDKMFEIFGPIFEQNANVNFEPIFEPNVKFGPIFEKMQISVLFS